MSLCIQSGSALLVVGWLLALLGCGRPSTTIAAIPQVQTEQLWQDAHMGVLRAAAREHVRIYWNAPDRYDDVQRQISLIQQVSRAHDAGLILAPAQPLALVLPVEQLVTNGLPMVIIHAALPIAPGGRLAYIVNNDRMTGFLAAEAIGRAIHGHGRVAILGVQPLQTGVMLRMQAFEAELATAFPEVHIAERIPDSADGQLSETDASSLLRGPARVDALFALSEASGIEIAEAVGRLGPRLPHPYLITCGQEFDLLNDLRRGQIQMTLAEDAYSEGFEAVQTLMRMRRGDPVPSLREVPPIVVTRETLQDPQVRERVTDLPDEPL